MRPAWRLFLSVAWLGPVLLIANRIYLRSAWDDCSSSRAKAGRASRTNLAENITGMRVVTAFNRQDPNLDVFNRLQDDNTDNNVRGRAINGIYQPLLSAHRLHRQDHHPALRRVSGRQRDDAQRRASARSSRRISTGTGS